MTKDRSRTPHNRTRRTTPLPPGWDRQRQRILRRDGHRCYLQGPGCIGHATHVDHIIPAAQGGTDDDTNLAAVCAPCHLSKTGREARAAQSNRRRPIDPHPGLT